MLAESNLVECRDAEADASYRQTTHNAAQPAASIPEAGLPPAQVANEPDDDYESPTDEEIAQFKPRRVPSTRNRDIYREVKILNRSERDVAKEFGLTQPRICAICKQVKCWMQEGGADLDGLCEQEKHNLCVNSARIRLSLTFSQAAKWLEATGQPSQTERIKTKDGIPDSEVVKKGPSPKPAFVGYMLRAAIELAKLDGAYDQGGVRSPERGIDGMTNSALRTPQSATRIRLPAPPNLLLSRRGAELAFGHIDTSDDEEANHLRAHGCSEGEIAELARRQDLTGPNYCYRAVAEAHAPASDRVDDLEFQIIGVQAAAEKADALARSYLKISEPPTADGKLSDPQQQEDLELFRRDFLETLLATDCHLTDEAYWAVIDRYQQGTGRFNWQLDTGRRDLATLLIRPWDKKQPGAAATCRSAEKTDQR